MNADPDRTHGRPRLTYDNVNSAAARVGLEIYGGFHPDESDNVPFGGNTLLLLGPAEPGFWNRVSAQTEFLDGQADPLDRWSKRVTDRLANELGADPCYPFGGPPWLPFFSWALRTGRCWQSPVQFLVHDTAGLFVSFRSALVFQSRIDLPSIRSTSPCHDCADQPCASACPAGALDNRRYNADRCRSHVAGPDGSECLDRGCLARRICPVSAAFGRSPSQSRFHQLAFIGFPE